MATAARGVETYLKFFQKQKVNYVLDYGAGKLRNTRYLAEHGFKVYAADLRPQVERIKTMPEAGKAWGVLDIEQLKASPLKVDLVVSTYVLNILHNQLEREELLGNCQANLKPNGYFLVEVLCKDCKRHCSTGCPGQSGYSLKNAFTNQELDALIMPFGFKRLGHCYGRNAISVLYQKIPEHTEAITGSSGVSRHRYC